MGFFPVPRLTPWRNQAFPNEVGPLATGFFSDDTVSEVRGRSSILEVVSDYVNLKKTGKNHKGLCPFHTEKTPSFMVNEDKQIFHCFGCGEGGDVFSFLIKVGHFSFPQAVEELAKRYGVRITPRDLSPLQKRETARREVLYQINQIALEYFHDLLMRRREGEQARKYLSQRGLNKDLLVEYQLGYSLDIWNGLVQHLQEKKVDLELARELGLILPRKREGWYDVFRGRIIFPIFDVHRRAVGFGGRILKEGQPKYLNSPESIVYHKGEVLYGLHGAKQSISEKESVLLVEGYFDLLTLHQFGFKNSVATSGTALTPQHIRILKRYTNTMVTLFDADQAGIQATLRCLPLFLEESIWAKAIILPPGEDPDTYLRKGHLEEFKRQVAEAIPLFDFFFDHLMKTHDVRSIDGRVKVAEQGVTLLRRIPEGIRRNVYVKALAEKIDLQESVLHDMLRTPSKEPSPREGRREKEGARGPWPRSEEMIVRLMVHHPDIIPKVSSTGVLDDFESPVLKQMAERLMGLHEKGGRQTLAEGLEHFEEDVRRQLSALAIQENGLGEGPREKILEDCIQNMRERRIKSIRGELLRRIKEAEKRQGRKELEALLLERQELTRREGGLRKEKDV